MNAIEDIIAERLRQTSAEGWSDAHDDEHHSGELARAAGWYALNASAHAYNDVLGVADPYSVANEIFAEPDGFYAWPWPLDWWKPKNRRRDLVRAGALIVAEIERLDRASIMDRER